MHRHKFILWCWTFLLVASCESWGNFMTTSNDKQNNSTVRYEIYSDVTTTDRSDKEELGNDRNSSTNSHELRRNVRQAEDRSNLTMYEFQGKLSEDDITLPYEMCENITCVWLCCPLGSRLVVTGHTEICTAEKANYSFPDVYDYVPVTDDLWERIPLGKKLDQVYHLSVHDPCNFSRYWLEPDIYPDDEYTVLDDGTLYLPRVNMWIELYCFAVLDETNKYKVTACFSHEDEDILEEVSFWDFYTVTVGLIVSLLFLLVTFLVYSILPELRNMHGYILCAYVASVFVGYMFLGTLLLLPPDLLPDSACITSAFIMHFSILASFFWLNVMCFDIWWTFGRLRSLQENGNKRERKKFVMYSIYAWGSASLFAILWAIMDFVPSVPKEFFRPEFGVSRCSFNTYQARLLYYYVPESVTVICNICLFISTVLKLMRYKKDTAYPLRGSESRRYDDKKQRFNQYLKLLFVMGVNLSLEISYDLFEYPEDGIMLYVRCLIDLIRTLQGLFVFIIFVCKERIKRLLLIRFKLSGS